MSPALPGDPRLGGHDALRLARLLERTDIHTSRGAGLVKIDVDPWRPLSAYGCTGATWAEAIDKAHAHLDSIGAA